MMTILHFYNDIPIRKFVLIRLPACRQVIRRDYKKWTKGSIHAILKL